jgi:hypothetical protein
MTDDIDACLQLATCAFDFDLIRQTRLYKKYDAFALEADLVRDICRQSTTDDPDTTDYLSFLYVIQKSPKWLTLRAAAQATASSIGKYIKSPTYFPTTAQLTEAWMEKITAAPFRKTHAMTAHMKWGVTYEDSALMHFAVENMFCVVQVGTIRVPVAYVYSLNTDPEVAPFLTGVNPDWHLLISPDGIVQKPDQSQTQTQTGPPSELADTLLGMLEIKCISPFHHVEAADGTLKWVEDMEKRQWSQATEIPFGYIIQICLQAISGYYRCDMNGDHTMWFIRWSPKGFSEFKIPFQDLVPLGITATALYFCLYDRIHTPADLPVKYTTRENILHGRMVHHYNAVMTKMVHRYVSHEELYPEFSTYRKCTQFYKFKVRD